MREKSKDAIRLGVIAHAIDELASGDARDTLVRLTLLYHAAKRIGPMPAPASSKWRRFPGLPFRRCSRIGVKGDPSLQSLA